MRNLDSDSDSDNDPDKRTSTGRRNRPQVFVTYRPESMRGKCGTPYAMQQEKYKREIDNGLFPGRESPPSVSMHFRRRGESMPIGRLIFEDYRYARSRRILIFIRGPPLTGKSYLAKKILEIERKYKNNSAIIINGVRLYARRPTLHSEGPSHIAEHLNEAIRDNHSFIIVEMKTTNSSTFHRCLDIGQRYHFDMYCIELFVDPEVQARRVKMDSEYVLREYLKYVREYSEHMSSYETPWYVTPLDPSQLFDKKFQMKSFMSNYESKFNYKATNACKDDYQVIRDFLNDFISSESPFRKLPRELATSGDLFNDLVQFFTTLIPIEFKNEKKSVVKVCCDKMPTFQAKRSIDYNHEHLMTIEEDLEEFKIAVAYDYNHQRNQALINETSDVDIDKIIEKYKNRKRMKKFQFYEKFQNNADENERVYPNNNWQCVDSDRPALVGKRKKKKNKKILRILSGNSTKFIQKGVKRLKIDDTFESCYEYLMKILENCEDVKIDSEDNETSLCKLKKALENEGISNTSKIIAIVTKMLENLEDNVKDRKFPESTEILKIIIEKVNELKMEVENDLKSTDNDEIQMNIDENELTTTINQQSIEFLNEINNRLNYLDEFFKNREVLSQNDEKFDAAINKSEKTDDDDDEYFDAHLNNNSNSMSSEDKEFEIKPSKIRKISEDSDEVYHKASSRDKLDKKNHQIKNNSENIENSLNAMEIDSPLSTTPRHIDDLLKKTRLISVEESKRLEFIEYIKQFYTRLDKIPSISTILELVSQCYELLIIFDFRDEKKDKKQNRIVVYPKTLTENEILSSIAHEILVFGMKMIYDNEGKPYKVDDDDRKEELERIFFNFEFDIENNHEYLQKMLKDYNESIWHSKIIGILGEAMANGVENDISKQYEELWKFFMRILDDVEKFVNRFYSRNRLSVF